MELHIFIGLIAFVIACVVIIYRTVHSANLLSKLLDEIKVDRDNADRSFSRKNDWENKRNEDKFDYLTDELKRVNNLYYNLNPLISELRNRVQVLEKLLIEQEKNKSTRGD